MKDTPAAFFLRCAVATSADENGLFDRQGTRPPHLLTIFAKEKYAEFCKSIRSGAIND